MQRRLAELAVKHDLLVLSDEIYARVIYGGQYVSLMHYPGMEERTLIIDGFSKSFAMTGWRLGYTVAPPRIVPALNMLAVNSYTCVAEFSQYAAIEALKDREGATPRMVGEFTKRREQFIRDLNRIPGFRCSPPEGAFYAWVNISDTGMSAEELCRILLEEASVAAIPGAAFGDAGTDFVRFSFASSTATLQEAVERILKVSTAWQGTVGYAIRRLPQDICFGISQDGEFMRRMAELFLITICGFSIFAAGQARPLPGPDVQQIYQRLLPQIEKIPIFDHHAHPGYSDDPDVDAMAAPPGIYALRIRDTNPELIVAAKALFGYPYDDLSPEHGKWLIQKKAQLKKEKGIAYFSDILDKLNIEQGAANRAMMADYLDPKRFVWVFFVDSFMWPFDNQRERSRNADEEVYIPLQEKMLHRWMQQEGLSKLPADFGEYLKFVSHTLEDDQKKGGIAMKFEVAYFRSTKFS